MSKNYYQVTYKCNCLIDPWGGVCGDTSKFILKENCSIDTNTIYHKSHNNPWVLYELSEFISDEEISALRDLLNGNKLDVKIDDEYFIQIK